MAKYHSSAKEVWAPVIGWEKCYEVSTLGRVRSLERTVMRKRKKNDPDNALHPWTFKSRIIRPVLTGSYPYYPAVHLQFEGHRVSVSVSHLVVSAFNDPPVHYKNVRSVKYIDNNPRNCQSSNLIGNFS